MALDTKPACFAFTFGEEGGYTRNPKDSGNWTGGRVGRGVLLGTKYGISAAAHPHLDIRHLTFAQAEEIVGREYWDSLNLDFVPAGLDLALFDLSVNSGPGLARKWKFKSVYMGGSVSIQIQRICDWRLTFLHRLSNWWSFGPDWQRRVESCRHTALNLAASHPHILEA